MDINTLTNDLALAIGGSDTINGWCQANYGQILHVFMNLDVRNPPSADQCPCVCIYPAEKQYGGDTYNDAVESVCFVHDDRQESHGTLDNVVSYTGVKNVETLRQMVLSAISGVVADTADGQIDSISVDYDTISQFPFMTAAMAVVISVGWTIGSGDPAENE